MNGYVLKKGSPALRKTGMATPLVLAVLFALAALGGAVYYVTQQRAVAEPLNAAEGIKQEAIRESSDPVELEQEEAGNF